MLSSVFGPFAQDDEYGSRHINPMELYHNQVTHKQGVFSPRHFHHSWGIMMIQANLSAPCTVLDFPTRKAFAREISTNRYDIVGISSIVANMGKVREMCRMVREKSPHSVIIVGGHVAAIPHLEGMIDADYIVRGEGISWMRRYLGEDTDAPICHPVLPSGFNLRVMGVRIPNRFNPTVSVISSVGCPEGCNFCTTSAFFGGKGNVINFFSTGHELFRAMEQIEATCKAQSFSIIDENFLLQRQRAMELLEKIKKTEKSWSLHVFSSISAIRQYTYEELLELGISSIWVGLESSRANYRKLEGADTFQLARELQEHGILLTGSAIIGLEHHTPENLPDEIDHIITHEMDACQFMLYTPMPGTLLYKEMEEEGRLLDVDMADIHGQFAFNFQHPAITRKESKKFLDLAFQRDYERNGPTLFRMFRTTFKGWKRHRNHPEHRIRRRYRGKATLLRYVYPPVLWAMEKMLTSKNSSNTAQVRMLREEMEREFGLPTVAVSRLLGLFFRLSGSREEKRLARGQTYEPPTIISRKNWNQKT